MFVENKDYEKINSGKIVVSSRLPAVAGRLCDSGARACRRSRATSSSRSRDGCAWSTGGLVLGSGRVGLAGALGLGRRPLGGASASGSNLGWRRLGLARPSPRLGRRPLALNRRRPNPAERRNCPVAVPRAEVPYCAQQMPFQPNDFIPETFAAR